MATPLDPDYRDQLIVENLAGIRRSLEYIELYLQHAFPLDAPRNWNRGQARMAFDARWEELMRDRPLETADVPPASGPAS